MVSFKFCSVASLRSFARVDTASEVYNEALLDGNCKNGGCLTSSSERTAVTHSGQSVTPDFFYVDSWVLARPLSVIDVVYWPISRRSARIHDGASFYIHRMTPWPLSLCFSVFLECCFFFYF